MKNILITGASTGIGHALAKAFANKGYRVFGSVRKVDDVAKLKALSDNVVPLLFDVTDGEAIKKAAQDVEGQIGAEGLHGLINNAGIALTGPSMMLDLDVYRHQLEVNLIGTIAVTQAFIRLLGGEQNSPYSPGKIMMMSSTAGQLSAPFMTPYNASKHALEGYSHALRRELQIFGIDVIILGPGAIQTPIWTKSNSETPAEILNSPYALPLARFSKFFLKQGANGMGADKFAKICLHIFEKKRPKARYAIMNNKFRNWTIPRYLLSDRSFDRFIKKLLKI